MVTINLIYIISTRNQFSPHCKFTNENWPQFENDRDQINCYQNIGTKLTIIQKYNNQNGICQFLNSQNIQAPMLLDFVYSYSTKI